MKGWGATDRGRARPVNEDSYFVLPLANGCLACGVADGLGGHPRGEEAANLAVEVAQDYIRREFERVGGCASGQVEPGTIAKDAIWAAHRRVQEAGGNAMGSTLTVAILAPGKAGVGHVGDSRAYLWRQGQLRQLTSDHSPVGEMVRRGELTEGEARRHPQRHLLDQAVGAGPLAFVDEVSISVERGDCFLLCTDGLTAVVDGAEISEVLSRENPSRVPDRLVGLANSRGGPDNITVVVAEANWEDRAVC